MGHSPSNINDSQDPDSQLKLNISIDKPVRDQLKQLLNWSLLQIREIYAPFRRRKTSPLLTRSQFLHFIQLSRITSFYIYDTLAKTEVINAFEVLCILVMGAYTNYIYKIQFLFNVFDFRSKKRLNFYELIFMFKSLVRAYCFLTDQTIPDKQLLDKYSTVMFSKADLNNDQLLELGQQDIKQFRIVGWLETSTQNLFFFKLFQPSIYSKEDYYIFNSFVSYSHDQINIMITRMNKVYQKQKLSEEDYLTLKQKIKQTKQNYNNNQNINQRIYHKSLSRSLSYSFQTTHSQNRKEFIQIHNKQNQKNNNNSFLPSIENNNSSKYEKRKKFQNIIIVKGKTITKKQIYQLRQYFDNLSAGKKYILIDDFIESFNEDRFCHMKSVAASLYNFLDKHQHGKVLFLDLVTKLYPNLTKQHIDTIKRWSDEYNRNFNVNKKIKVTQDNDQIKKRILPRTCIIRLQELYNFFDTEQKGFVNIENLRQILGRACTEKQIQLLFESSDLDKDGKLTLKQFVHVLLPSDLQIEGLM